MPVTLNKINKKDIEDIIALTPTHEGMLYHFLKDQNSDYYFEQLSLTITGEIDLKCLTQAWNFVVETNEMLRTVFRWEKLEKPAQVVLKRHTLHLKYEDLSDIMDSVQQEKQWDTIKQQDRNSRFD
ncbi:MAG: hypothetical protein GY950_11750, partial [bacterium]|nr:hypothetical protein [bacterium]